MSVVWQRTNLDQVSVALAVAKPTNFFTPRIERDINLRFGLGPFPRGRPTRRYVMRCWAPPLCILFICGMDGCLGTRQCDVSDSRECDACEENYPFSRPDRVGEPWRILSSSHPFCHRSYSRDFCMPRCFLSLYKRDLTGWPPSTGFPNPTSSHRCSLIRVRTNGMIQGQLSRRSWL